MSDRAVAVAFAFLILFLVLLGGYAQNRLNEHRLASPEPCAPVTVADCR